MGLMDGKKGIIFGVSNKFGIANAIAEQLSAQGAEIAFTYANEAMEKRVRPIAESMNAKMCVECDVTKEEDVKKINLFVQCIDVFHHKCSNILINFDGLIFIFKIINIAMSNIYFQLIFFS